MEAWAEIVEGVMDVRATRRAVSQRLMAGALALPVLGAGCGRQAGEPGASRDTSTLGFDSTRLAQLQQVMDRAFAERQIGCGLAVVSRDGQVAFEAAVGEMAPGVPMRSDAICRLSSIGKAFTATAIMILYEQARLRLDNDIAMFIPEFATATVGAARTPLIRPITIGDLLTHRAGLRVTGPAFEAAFDAAETTLDLSRRLAALPMAAQPGEAYDYGYFGSSYEVLGAIIEIVSGQKLDQFFSERIFTPLGMQDSYFFVPEDKKQRLAPVYKGVGDDLSVFRARGEEEPVSTFLAGGGGVRGTIQDFHRFSLCLLQEGELEGARILSPHAVRLMTADHVGEQYPSGSRDYGWGFGFQVRRRVLGADIGSVGTFGWNGGTGTCYWVDPQEKLIGIVFTQTQPPAPYALFDSLEVSMYQAIARSQAR